MNHPARRIDVLAAGFHAQSQAATAAAELRRVLDIGDGDLSIDQVGGDEEFVDGAAVVLAGRIREARRDEVEAILRRHGGVILTVVPERWAKPTDSRRRAVDDSGAVPG